MSKLHSRAAAATAVLAAGAVVLSACGSSGSPAAKPAAAGAARLPGGTVTVAQAPQSAPNYIWPYAGGSNFSTINAAFGDTMYRPLYWFGDNGSPNVDLNRSVGQAPVWGPDGKSVSITVNPYKWSNGESVDAKDIGFFINVYKATADPKNASSPLNGGTFGGYVPPNGSLDFFPDNVTNWTAAGNTITLTLDKAYSQGWFLENELSQLFPMPEAWDVTASGPSDCTSGFASPRSKTEADCLAVDHYLDTQSKDIKDWATSPLWAIVDGPWKLAKFDSGTGAYSQVPNPAYSGPFKATLKEVDYVPETTDDAEFAQLRHGDTGSGSIQVGYVPSQDLAQRRADGSSTDVLKAQGYVQSAAPNYQYTYYQLNYSSKKAGALFRQLYFRRALQETIDQQGIVDGVLKGWGYATEGVVPTYPPSNLDSPAEKSNPVPAFNVADAKAQLAQNGWDTSSSPATCQSPGTGSGQCGAGIAKGQAAEFTMEWATGTAALQTEVDSMKSDAAQAGIKIDLTSNTFNGVLGLNVPCNTGNPAGTAAGCTWDALNWGGGWVYAPDYYPTGEELYQTNATSNQGEYNDPMMNQLIEKTTTSSDLQDLYAYNDYATQQLVSPFFPTAIAVAATASNLHVDPAWNVFTLSTPEDWYYTK